MRRRPLSAMIRLALAVIGNVFLFAFVQTPGVWLGQSIKPAQFFRVALAASLVLVVTVGIMVQGRPEEKVAAFVLSVAPLLFLGTVLYNFYNSL